MGRLLPVATVARVWPEPAGGITHSCFDLHRLIRGWTFITGDELVFAVAWHSSTRRNARPYPAGLHLCTEPTILVLFGNFSGELR
jgi:hypothetical protein